MSKKVIKEEKPVIPVIDFFESLGNQCQWIALGLLLIIAVIVFKDFLFFDKIFLYKDIGSDSLNFSDPLFAHSCRSITQSGFPSWSFEFGMGQNSFAYTLFDPIDIFLYPLGINTMRNMLGYKVVFELVLAGFVFYHYLRMLKMSQLTCITGSLIYAFSGFMIVGSCWFIFSVEVLSMAFILLGFEKLYQKNNFWIFPLPILFIVISRPFVLATLTIFLFIYISFRLLQDDKFNWKVSSLTFGKVALAGLAGVLMVAPWLFEHLQLMLDSPRGSGANSLTATLKATPMFSLVGKQEFGTAICRMFASDILGSGNDYKGWANIMEAPTFYCSVVSLILIPQLFFTGTKRSRIIYAAFLGIWILPVLFPYFRYAFSFFTGDYYRSFSFYMGLVMTILALISLDQIIKSKKINLIVLASSVIALLGLLYYPYFDSDEIRQSNITSFVTLVMIVFAGLLFYLPKENRMAQFGFLALLTFELIYTSSISVNNRDIMSTADLKAKVGYNDYSNEAIDFIKKQDKGFYRIDKRYASSPAMHSSLNDGMAQGYFGTSSYNSFNQKYYIQFLKALGIIEGKAEAETRWASGLTSRIIPEALNSVKYVLSKQPSDNLTLAVFDSIGRFGDVTVLKHKYAMPIGFAYKNVLSLKDFMQCTSAQKDFLSLQTAIVADSNMNAVATLKKMSLSDTISPSLFSFELIQRSIDSLSKEVFIVKDFSQTHFNGSINLQSPSLVYFSLPYDKFWKINDDKHKEYKAILLTNGMTGVYLEAGVHQLDFTFKSDNISLGKKVSMAGFAFFALLIFLTLKFKKNES